MSVKPFAALVFCRDMDTDLVINGYTIPYMGPQDSTSDQPPKTVDYKADRRRFFGATGEKS